MFKNGNRFVKWLLRILPFLVFLGAFIYACKSITNIDYTRYSPNVMMTTFIDNISNVCTEYGDNFFSMFGLTDNIIQFFNDNFAISSSTPFNLDFIISTMVYELFLSFLFLIFDVFNYMFTICNKFLNKGEKLDE